MTTTLPLITDFESCARIIGAGRIQLRPLACYGEATDLPGRAAESLCRAGPVVSAWNAQRLRGVERVCRTDPEASAASAYTRQLNHGPRCICRHRLSTTRRLLQPAQLTVAYFSSDHVALDWLHRRIASTEFLPNGALLENVHRLPTYRSDPGPDPPVWRRTADDLHRAWPEAEYIVVPDAGHSAWEPGIRAQLVAATERFKTTLV
jgi:hypothetical protein